jgi:cold shock CspA family protein
MERFRDNKIFLMKGKIKKYLSSRGYGFIESEEHEKDIFFHNSSYPVYSTPIAGQSVEFKVKTTKSGIEAVDIKEIIDS